MFSRRAVCTPAAVVELGGDALRSKINNDLLLLDLLREFLPTYTGPTLELFRGETAWNRRRRTQGMSAEFSKAKNLAIYR